MSVAQTNLEKFGQLAELIPDRLHEAKGLLADDFVWTYVNPLLPQIDGDYQGADGFTDFFRRLGDLTNGTFSVRAKDVSTFGDELVVVHAAPSMTLDGETFETNAAVVWRFVDGRIKQAWDIPAVYTIPVELEGRAH
ncbi:MAG: nuclear transport factor 2 family protein [Pseudomonadota bacterium]